MKRVGLSFLLGVALFLGSVLSSWAAGTCTFSSTGVGMSKKLITATCVADAADGTWPTTTAMDVPQLKGLFLQTVTYDPGTTAPTALTDISLTDSGGADILDSELQNQSATVSYTADINRPIYETHRLVIAQPAVATNSAQIVLYFRALNVQ